MPKGGPGRIGEENGHEGPCWGRNEFCSLIFRNPLITCYIFHKNHATACKFCHFAQTKYWLSLPKTFTTNMSKNVCRLFFLNTLYLQPSPVSIFFVFLATL